MWRDVMLRGAGFPASDLTALASPALAAAADLAAGGDLTAAADYRHAYDRAVDDLRAGVARTAWSPGFREGVLWQKQAVVHHHLDKAAAGGPRNAQLAALRKENAQLKRANGVLRTASAFFAAQLDPTRPR
ncbi:hypothetical protein OG539_38380 [Actinacidiphila glaucinigra]|uniref:hypothetical protein n=1 Tax=Actinacidiphila glaucinigra TaxID=235986 RepID=UPI003243B16A